MKLVLASDHAGYFLKNTLRDFLIQKKIDCVDLGPFSTASVDYPDFAHLLCEQIQQGRAEAGVLICGTGVGISIAANKIKGIRAAVVSDLFSARMAKEHNNANVLALGARILDEEKAKRVLWAWLKAKYAGGRHQQRLDQIKNLESL
ncbi:MAG: ribose 5-phosphate isomerase B [Deltaproteobacteria bacterium]|nr:ribose 5-phosphate isomerase B [Deltaproteobacteria bacterium]